MGKLDEIKGEIDWLGRWLNVLIVANFALIGWLALNYKTQEQSLIYLASVAIVFLSIVIAFINSSAIKKIRQMRDLKNE